MSHFPSLDLGSTASADGDPAVGNAQLALISREMVRLYKERFGRGPTRAKTHYAGPDTLVCTLEDTLAPVERTLKATGQVERLRSLRLDVQHASENASRSVIEQICGRRVRAFVSGFDTEMDVVTEVFHLEPSDSPRLDDRADPVASADPG